MTKEIEDLLYDGLAPKIFNIRAARKAQEILEREFQNMRPLPKLIYFDYLGRLSEITTASDFDKYYENIDLQIADDIACVLDSNNLDWRKHALAVSSILRTSYCKHIILKCYHEEILAYKNFQAEFHILYKSLFSTIEKISIVSDRVDASVVIKNERLINLFKLVFSDAILSDEYTMEQLFEMEKGSYDENVFQFDEQIDFGDRVISLAAINLLFYIQANTDFKDNVPENDFLVLKFSNGQLKLVYDLLKIGNLTEDIKGKKDKDTGRITDEIERTKANYTRNIIKRFIEVHPEILQDYQGIKLPIPEESDPPVSRKIKYYTQEEIDSMEIIDTVSTKDGVRTEVIKLIERSLRANINKITERI